MEPYAVADVLAIPAFLTATVYFAVKSDKNLLEYFLLAFSVIGLCCDVVFTSSQLF